MTAAVVYADFRSQEAAAHDYLLSLANIEWTDSWGTIQQSAKNEAEHALVVASTPTVAPDPRDKIVLDVGTYVVNKYRARVEDSGHFAVAKQLKKQGFPLEISLLILVGKVVV